MRTFLAITTICAAVVFLSACWGPKDWALVEAEACSAHGGSAGIWDHPADNEWGQGKKFKCNDNTWQL